MPSYAVTQAAMHRRKAGARRHTEQSPKQSTPETPICCSIHGRQYVRDDYQPLPGAVRYRCPARRCMNVWWKGDRRTD